MTARTVKEWIASGPDAAVPPRVKVRIVERFNRRCAECKRMLGGRLGCEFDHEIALSNGGEHRERNLRPLCVDCHAPKTAADRKVKAKGDRIIKSTLGLKHQKGRGWSKTYRGRPIKHKVGGRVVYADTGEPV